jgi:hypothetical protein
VRPSCASEQRRIRHRGGWLRRYDLSWCSFHCVEVMSQSKLSLKHTGYLAAQQSFLDNTDVLLLIPNLLKKDLASACVQEAGMALDCLANIMTPDLARDLVGDVFSLLNRCEQAEDWVRFGAGGARLGAVWRCHRPPAKGHHPRSALQLHCQVDVHRRDDLLPTV